MAELEDSEKVAALLRYFDADGDGRLKQPELGKLWAAVSSGQQLSKAQYAAACAQAGARPKQGLDAEALAKLYSQGFASLDDHFEEFLEVRELPEDRHLRQQLKSATRTTCSPQRVDKMAHLCDGSCVVLSFEPQLFLFEEGVLKSLSCSPEWIYTGCPASSTAGLLVAEAGEFKVVDIDRRRRDKPRAKVVRSFGGFPKEWGKVLEDEDEDIWDACLGADGTFHLAALAPGDSPKPCFLIGDSDEDDDADPNEGSGGSDEGSGGEEDSSGAEEPPIVYPEPPKWRRLVAAHGGKRVEVCRVPHESSVLSLSPDGLWCSYQVLAGEYPEEANRGEWYVCELTKGAEPRQISRGELGRVGQIAAPFSPSGVLVVYQANHTESRPITQHMDLWLVDLHAGEEVEPVQLTPGGMQIDAFGWVAGREDALWVSATCGHELRSFTLDLKEKTLQRVTPAAAFKCLPSWNPCTQKCVYPVESATQFEGLWDEKAARVSRLQDWSSDFEDIHVDIVQWEGPRCETVCGGVYYSQNFSGSERTLLVWVHGGPTCSWPVLRGNFANDMRSAEPNFTALVRAGYLLFVPLYRGTLGFGDHWSTASIGSQGSHRGDLGDILSGVAHLRAEGFRGCGPLAGIVGESYGGYLTIKALSDPEAADIFSCGVSLYGYINNREATLMTGDLTWEQEYVGPATQWPPPLRVEDCNLDLGNISSPLLLLHGDKDECCPTCHSVMVHRALLQRGVPTELAIYPGQGHGFEGDRVQRDVNWRILQWFLRHLPPSGAP